MERMVSFRDSEIKRNNPYYNPIPFETDCERSEIEMG